MFWGGFCFLSHLSGDEELSGGSIGSGEFLSHLSGDEDPIPPHDLSGGFLSHLSGDEGFPRC